MLVENLKDQWICSCGNWVDQAFNWCPDCCENKLRLVYDANNYKKEVDMAIAARTGT